MLEQKIERWLSEHGADWGISAAIRLWNGKVFTVGGAAEPQVVISVRHRGALWTLLHPTIDGLADAYVNGGIDIEGKLADVVGLAHSFAASRPGRRASLLNLSSRITHSRRKDQEAIQFHYDVSDAFYRIWLGETMVYSCAYFERGDENLDTAQRKKVDHVLRKIALRPGQRLLDIGCGWGELVIRAARESGASCLGITLSQNQCDTARRRVAEAGLSDRVEIRLQDYRDITGTFDRITSIGMFEHVGRRNLAGYFAKMRSLLTDDGWAMNHGITSTDPEIGKSPMVDGGKFMDRYVFPNGELPHLAQVLEAMQQGGMEAYDVENLRRHYASTLNRWIDTFEACAPAVIAEAGDKRFRIWRIYLAGCAYAFEHDQLSIYQIVCHKAAQSAQTLPWSRRYIYAGAERRAASNARPASEELREEINAGAGEAIRG